MMKNTILIVIIFLSLFDFGYPQSYSDDGDVEEARLHKKKKQRYRPCRRSYDNYDEKTLVNLYVNNYPSNGAGGGYDPCSSGQGYPSSGNGGGGSSGGHLSNLLGSHGGNLLSSHPILSGLLGNFGLGGNPSGGSNPSTAIATAIAGAGGSSNTQPASLGGGQGGNLGTVVGAIAGAGGNSGSNDPIKDNVHEDELDKRGPLFPRESSIVGAYLDLFGFGGGYNRPHVPQRPNYNQYNNQVYPSKPGYGNNAFGGNYQNNYYRDQAFDKNSKFLGHPNNNPNNGYHQANRNTRPNYVFF